MNRIPSSHNSSTSEASSSIDEAAVLLVHAARKQRLGLDVGIYRSHPPGEYAMFGMARLLDAIAFSMYVDGAVHHTVASGATEIARHVLDYLLPTLPTDVRPR